MGSWRWEGVTGHVCGPSGRFAPTVATVSAIGTILRPRWNAEHCHAHGLLLQEVSDDGAPNLQVRAAFHRRRRRYRILVDDQVIDRPPACTASPGDIQRCPEFIVCRETEAVQAARQGLPQPSGTGRAGQPAEGGGEL